MKKWWALYQAQRWDKQILWGAALLALVPVGFGLVTRTPKAPIDSAPAAIDTYIPRGFVLVPIEADNYESLDSILGPYGWVDLFQAGAEGGEKHAVARNVRLLRAPQNPSHFAVLIPERQSAHLLRAGGVFTVVVRAPGRAGTEFVNSGLKPGSHAPRRITYGGE